jgi:anti-sigma-K factor RskA
MNNDFQEQDAIRYFLGELSETEQTAVEERFFTDADFSDWLDEVETDLIDSYVRGELDAAQRRKFEQNFLVSGRRQSRVKAAAALWEKEKSFAPAAVAETAKPSVWESLKNFISFPQLAYASLGVLLLALIGVIAFIWQHPTEIVKIGNENIKIEPTKQPAPPVSPETAPTQTPFETPQSTDSQTVEPKQTPLPDKQSNERKKETPKEVRQDSPVMAQFGLSSSSLRSGGTEPNKINLRSGTRSVRLRLKFKSEEEFVKYRIELRDGNGTLISSQNLENKNALGITVSAKKLRKGSYKITLKGAKANQDFEDLDFYDFSVEKK